MASRVVDMSCTVNDTTAEALDIPSIIYLDCEKEAQ